MGSGFVRIQKEARASGCEPLLRARAWVMGWGLNFASLTKIHMLMSGRIIPAIGEPPIPPSVDSAWELFCHLWVCLLAYRLGINVWLVFDLSSWTQLILIGLCYTPMLCHSFKGCALPPFPSCFMVLSSAPSRPTVLPLQSSGGITRKYLVLGGKYCIISNPLVLPSIGHAWDLGDAQTPARGSQEVITPWPA